ncbi:Uncharacterised protein [Enterobacter hormaechei]|nr:Uncharacterised protein [Enterobacter hormaechei]SAA89978.1 Uncharacterised protein [Enterobacter hormaechei]SAB42651.1 Uncharacterised protein [Enterobacter hormaechei]SAB76880.1 Uncharacterised protein [Enterobacter hormaechei]SAG19587.1 Uncharacterised protein [Enterobacter hormaechei]
MYIFEYRLLNQIRVRTDLTVDVRLGLVNSRDICLTGQAIVGRVDGITAVVCYSGLRRQERKYLTNHFKDRAQDVADNALWLVEYLDVVQLAQLKRQLIIVTQLYAIADNQQVTVKVSVIGRQPVIKKGAVWHPATQLRRSWKIRYLNQRHIRKTPLW